MTLCAEWVLFKSLDTERAFGKDQHEKFIFNDVHTVAPLKKDNMCTECCSAFFG